MNQGKNDAPAGDRKEGPTGVRDIYTQNAKVFPLGKVFPSTRDSRFGRRSSSKVMVMFCVNEVSFMHLRIERDKAIESGKAQPLRFGRISIILSSSVSKGGFMPTQGCGTGRSVMDLRRQFSYEQLKRLR